MNSRKKYKNYMMKNRKDIKKDISRIKELARMFMNTDEEMEEYDLLFKTLLWNCKVFNMRFNSHITIKQFIDMFII